MKDLRLLELAVALDQHRHFGRAADAMRVTQPTFSRAIAALEAELGARLFDRSSTRVEPTPAGQVLLARARPLLADAAALRAMVGDYESLRSGRVVVGAGPYALELSVIDTIARLVERHPLLQFEVLEGQWRDFGPKLLAGDIEIAVVESSVVTTDSRFHVETLPTHQGAYYCRRGHPLAGRTGLTLEDILEFPLVGVRVPLRAIGKPHPRLPIDATTGDVVPHIATTSVAASRAFVKRTDAIGIAVPAQIAEDVRQGTLVLLDTDARTLRTAYGVAHLRDRSLSPGAQAFVTMLKLVDAEVGAIRPPATRGRRHDGARAR